MNARGAASVVILTVLLLFALVAITIFELTRLATPEIRVDSAGTRALMLAHAGIQMAVEELPRAAARPWQGGEIAAGEVRPGEFWTYWGEDSNANGVLDSGEDVNGNGVLDNVAQPLGEAVRPSMAVMKNSSPDAVLVRGRFRGMSGYLKGRYQPQGDHYVLRVTDASSRIWINGPSTRTQVMLVHLARRIGLDKSVAWKIIQNRPEKGYRTVEDTIPQIGMQAWAAISPYLTADAWIDPRTLAICPLDDRVRPMRPEEVVISLGDLRPRSVEAEPRAPVNLNTAPAPVLAAVFEGVQGAWVEQIPGGLRGESGFGARYEWMESHIPYGALEGAVGILRASPPVTAGQADLLAAAILAQRLRFPFRTWNDVSRFLHDQVRDGVISAPQAEAIRANADPNAMLNDFNPDRNAWAPVDKTDLLTGTTEFCFASMGHFVVESLGRVLDPTGNVLGERLLKVHVKAYEVWRETVESEFLSAFSRGENPNVLIGSHDGYGRTRGGFALEVLPEAFDPKDPKVTETLWYDGRIGLATLQAPAGAETWLRASLTPPKFGPLPADDFRVRDPRRRAGSPPPEDVASQPLPEGSPEGGPLISIAPAPQPGDEDSPRTRAVPAHLFPDGAYLERASCLRYRAMDNLPFVDGETRNGCVSFWLKPALDPALSGRPSTLWSIDRRKLATSPGLIESPPFGAWLFPPGPEGVVAGGPYSYGFPLRGLVGFGIGGLQSDNSRVTAGIATGRAEFAAFRPHEWVHVAFAWDFDQPADRAFRMAVNGRLLPPANTFEQIAGSLPLRGRIDLSAQGPVESTWISFGALGSDPQRNLPLDGTIDEIRVGTALDFESARRDAVEGRYARVDDLPGGRREGATFTSSSRSPGSPSVPGSISWTVRDAESLPDSAVRMEFWDGRRWRGPFDDPGGAALVQTGERPLETEYRWRATFTTGVRRDAPVNESPWLDDVTVTWVTRPRILAWSTPPGK